MVEIRVSMMSLSFECLMKNARLIKVHNDVTREVVLGIVITDLQWNVLNLIESFLNEGRKNLI